MLVKTYELIGKPLDYAAALADGRKVTHEDGSVYWPELTHFSPSTTWLQAGVFIGREGLTLSEENTNPALWSSYIRKNLFNDDGSECWQTGPTPLVAVMRCYVASKLGDEVEIPDELIEG